MIFLQWQGRVIRFSNPRVCKIASSRAFTFRWISGRGRRWRYRIFQDIRNVNSIWVRPSETRCVANSRNIYGRNLAEATMSLEEDLQSLQIPPEFADYRRRLICLFRYRKRWRTKSAGAAPGLLQEYGALEQADGFPRRRKDGRGLLPGETKLYSVSRGHRGELREAFRRQASSSRPDGRMGLCRVERSTTPCTPQQWALRENRGAGGLGPRRADAGAAAG